MPIPTRIELDQAVRSARVRLRVPGPDLREGAVEMVRYETSAGAMEEPWGMEGGFAVVYKYRLRDGRLRALRVFKRLVPDDIEERYRLLHPFLRRHLPSYTVECIYHAQAILVKHQAGGEDVYPLLEMDWVEGETLLQCVDRACRAGDAARLQDLAWRWQTLYRDMRDAGVAHGDLSGANVMVRRSGDLVLIDYDGVYTPELARFAPLVLGQPDYQHPQASRRPYHAGMDGFSFLVVYTALLALAADPSRWARHTQRGPSGDLLNENLLFRRDDFERPGQSALMSELECPAHRELAVAVDALRAACQSRIEDVAVPESLLGPGTVVRQALDGLVRAIWHGSSRDIVRAWTPALARCPQARIHASRVRAARQQLAALERLRLAIVLDDDLRIATSCPPTLEASPELTAVERARVDLARRRNAALLRFHKALHSEDDRRIASEYDSILDGHARVRLSQRDRLALARCRLDRLHRLRVALYRDDDEAIAAAYSPILDGSSLLAAAERARVDLAQRRVPALRALRRALADGDDLAAAAAYTPALDGSAAFDAAMREAVAAARARLLALARFRLSLLTGDDWAIVAAWDPMLDGRARLLPLEWALLLRARDRVRML